MEIVGVFYPLGTSYLLEEISFTFWNGFLLRKDKFTWATDALKLHLSVVIFFNHLFFESKHLVWIESWIQKFCLELWSAIAKTHKFLIIVSSIAVFFLSILVKFFVLSKTQWRAACNASKPQISWQVVPTCIYLLPVTSEEFNSE